MLVAMGCEVEVCETAEHALQLLASGCMPDMVLADVGLPGRLSGIDLAAELMQTHPEILVVLMSGTAMERMSALGWKVLQKPFCADDLAVAIRSLRPLR